MNLRIKFFSLLKFSAFTRRSGLRLVSVFSRKSFLTQRVPKENEHDTFMCLKKQIQSSVLRRADLTSEHLVTVIISTYNSEETVEESVCSIIRQDYLRLEILIIDDCSTDSTRAVLERMKLEYSDKIQIVFGSENRGVYFRKNQGLKLATGKFIIFHDSDDIAHSSKVSLQALMIQNVPKAYSSSSFWVKFCVKESLFNRKSSRIVRWNCNSLMFDREVFIEKLGYYDRVRFGGDSEFFERSIAVLGKDSHVQVPAILTLGLDLAMSLMNDPDSHSISPKNSRLNREQYKNLYEKWHDDHSKNSKMLWLDEGESILEKVESQLGVPYEV